jgi:O-acetylserine/cysteine efflux transporter
VCQLGGIIRQRNEMLVLTLRQAVRMAFLRLPEVCTSMNRKDSILALLVILAWGFNFVIIRWGLDELPPLLLGALRFICVAFPAIFFVARPRLAFRWPGSPP